MIRLFLLGFARSLRANKVLSLINVLSLGLGLTVFVIALLYVQRELSYDREWPNVERIHRLVVERRGLSGEADGFFTRVSPRDSQALLDYFPERIEAATRLVSEPVYVGEESSGPGTFLTLVDPAFADIFGVEVVDGSLERVLGNPGFIALSEARAEALGDQGRVGERLLLKSPWAGGEQEFEVAAILRLPALTAQPIAMLSTIGAHAAALFVAPVRAPWEGSAGLWLALGPGVGAQHLDAELSLFVDHALEGANLTVPSGSRLSEHLFYRLQPIRDVHLNPRGFEPDALIFGDPAKVVTFAAVSLLVLLLGCSNSMSLSLAKALRRRREVGIRKASGAGHGTIVVDALGESVLLALAAGTLALLLQALLLAPVLALLNIEGALALGWTEFGGLLAIAILMGLVNGAYPAFVLAGLRPQLVLRSEAGDGGRGSFRARVLLVGGQFSLAVMFLAGALALYAQLTVARAQALGYDHRNLLYFSHPGSSTAPNASVIVNHVGGLPGVVNIMPLVTVPPNMDLPLNINAINLVSKQGREVDVQATRLMIVEDFPETLGIPLLAGRLLDANRDSRASGNGFSATIAHALINRRAAEALGFASPETAVDQIIYLRRSEMGDRIDSPLRVVGVLEDNLYSSIHRRPVPELYALPPTVDPKQFLLRYEPAVAGLIQQRVAKFYESYGVTPYFEFIESRIAAAYFQERSESRLFLIAAAMALLLSCIGLYGLAAAAMARSVKEVGVRKVLGASAGRVVLLFLWRFSRPILLANLIAWPVAGWFVLRWIQQFPYQLDLAWLPSIFLGASALVLLVAWLTVAGVTARAAMRAPVQSLRYE